MAEVAKALNIDTARVAGIAGGAWLVNWLWFKLEGVPVPYCAIGGAFGPHLLAVHDGLRAVVFVWVLFMALTKPIKQAVPAFGALIVVHLLPGFIQTLFGLGPCRPYTPFYARWSESIGHVTIDLCVWCWSILARLWQW